MMKKLMFWKNKRLLKHQVILVIIIFFVTILSGFVIVDEEEHLHVYSPILDIEDIKEWQKTDSSEKNKDLIDIKNILSGIDDVVIPWQQYLFHLHHFQIRKTGNMNYDISFTKVTGYSGWPFQFLFKYEVKNAAKTDTIYIFYEFGFIAFIADIILLYLFGCLMLITYYTFENRKKNRRKG